MNLARYVSNKIWIEFHSIYGLFIWLIWIFLVFVLPLDARLRSYSTQINTLLNGHFLSFGRLRLIFYVVIMIIFWIIRRINKYHIKKNKKNRIWIVIAIYAEKSEEEIKLKNDFIKKLKEQIDKLPVWDLIDVLTVENHIAEKISNDKKNIWRLHKKIRWHFYLYGSIKKRNINNYYLDLDWLVAHSPLVDDNIRQVLKADFISALPKTISFSESVEMEGFNVTVDSVFITIKYITWIASLISWDPFYAMNMHKDLKNELDSYKITEGIDIKKMEVDKIRRKLPYLIADELLSIAMINFYVNRDNVTAQNLLNESLKINPMNYNALVFQSIFEFVANWDANKALKATQRARDYANWNWWWRYNQAFLYFWMKNYKKAISICYRIKDTSFVGEEATIQQVEKFTLDLLGVSPNHHQLYFWLGYLNYHKTNLYKIVNYPRALNYLEKFEEMSWVADVLLTNISTAYLRDIKHIMKI